jgi:hypothetical protein
MGWYNIIYNKKKKKKIKQNFSPSDPREPKNRPYGP